VLSKIVCPIILKPADSAVSIHRIVAEVFFLSAAIFFLFEY
jgi:hypothetical protein